MKILYYLLFLLISLDVYSNPLMNNVKKLEQRKTEEYFNKGIFYKAGYQSTEIKGIRIFYSPVKGYERIVFDYNTSDVPRIYGLVHQNKQKIFIDMFQTSVSPSVQSVGESHHVKGFKFYPIDSDMLSIEIALKQGKKFDIFYLHNPGRLVLDIM